MSCFRRPSVHSATNRVTIDDGPVKKSGEIELRFLDLRH
jgi:hypothetical protein